MLTFLRKFRRSLIDFLPARPGSLGLSRHSSSDGSQAGGNTRKYLLYAIGEILLVMIGILLALQVNNWNEERKQLSKSHNILLEIKDNLEINTKRFEEEIKEDRSVINSSFGTKSV